MNISNTTKRLTIEQIMTTIKFHLLLLLTYIILPTTTPLANFPVAKPNCIDYCGDLKIPFPFGTTESCYQDYSFFVTCNTSLNPPKLFMQDTSIEITKLSLSGQLTVLQYISRNCYSRNGTKISENEPFIELPFYLTVNNTANKFTILGCDTYGFIKGRTSTGPYRTGCTATCNEMDDLSDGSCGGLGCCQITSIPKNVWKVELQLDSYENHTNVWKFNKCSYGFLVEESSFRFSPQNVTNLRHVDMMPMVVDWAIGNETCDSARTNLSSYACKSPNSKCYKPDNGYGYRCRCLQGYEGNPYLDGGCQDIDECSEPTLNNCDKKCINTKGGFKCSCPKGYHGNGIRPRGCIPRESFMFKCMTGISLGVIALMLTICCLYLDFKRRRSQKKKQQFFVQNGGTLLQEKLTRGGGSPNIAKIYSSAELNKATNSFNKNMIIGQGGFGIVYKGFLSDNTVVAIKKSKKVDPTQIEQFINEVIVLSQINHRNVVKLLGCCLETEAPLLVYELISNGTLFEHIQNQAKKRSLDWNIRLRIAIETANVLSYLHSGSSTPIIHRDVKSANILLDSDFTAKVADFGNSRLVPMDQTLVSTIVQGTLGYLDPEYMQTSQLTEKSDVYSFGVVLLELVTGLKALRYDCPEEERNLANFFICMLKQSRVLEIVDETIVCEGNREQLVEFAKLARACLHVRGEDRPNMKEVAMGLEGLRLGGKHSWDKEVLEDKDAVVYIKGNELDSYTNVDGFSTSTRSDGIQQHAEFSGVGR